MRKLFLLLTLVVLAVMVIGCGSHRTQNITTGGSGTLEGVLTIPRDGDRDIPIDSWIRVYWPSGEEPPSEFKFT